MQNVYGYWQQIYGDDDDNNNDGTVCFSIASCVVDVLLDVSMNLESITPFGWRLPIFSREICLKSNYVKIFQQIVQATFVIAHTVYFQRFPFLLFFIFLFLSGGLKFYIEAFLSILVWPLNLLKDVHNFVHVCFVIITSKVSQMTQINACLVNL